MSHEEIFDSQPAIQVGCLVENDAHLSVESTELTMNKICIQKVQQSESNMYHCNIMLGTHRTCD